MGRRNAERLERRFEPKRSAKMKRTFFHSFNWVMGRRCYWCGDPVIYVKRTEKPKRRIPIEARSWDGSVWYVAQVHRHHVCREWLKAKLESPTGKAMEAGMDADLIV
jgi:hypothetical protein